MTAIAIVGMGCRFAGASSLSDYWKLTLDGRSEFSEPPADRWDKDVFFSTSRRATDKTNSPKGGFIKDIQSFPALDFALPPRRLEVMDPQHRFALEVANEAIEDAGYRSSNLPRKTGVFLGMTANEYRVLMSSRVIAQHMASGFLGKAPKNIDEVVDAVENVVASRPFTAAGALQNMAAATVAQELDLHGPAYTVDAACASGMVAISDAVAQLRAGTIDAALAGGVYLCVTPENYLAFARIGAMSQVGLCRPFDEEADGFVQGDGAGVLLLKRLSDARRDGDRIYAVIQGVALNNDGRGEGPMAPLASGQEEVMRSAWSDAKMSPSRLGYMEAHGTGTSVGDQIEFSALSSVFSTSRSPIALGSAKANVGHTMSAAALAGVIRAALAIYHRTLPPLAHFNHSKPELGLDQSSFFIPTKATPWTADAPVAAVSSFGFGGTNGHVVLGHAPQLAQSTPQTELLLLAGPDEASVRRQAAALADALRSDTHACLAGVARTLSVRKPQKARLGLVASSLSEAIASLNAFGAGEMPASCTFAIADRRPKVAFLYPGQGSQRIGMLGDIGARFPVVQRVLGELERELKADLSVPLTHLLYPERRSAPIDDEAAQRELTNTAHCQPALLSCGVALTELLSSVGLRPDVVLGHSLGEFTAAAAAGVLSPADAARFVARRGQAMNALPGDHGAMAALRAPAHQVEALLVDGAVVANINHPRQTVISGQSAAVLAVIDAATQADIPATRLDVSHGFHSPVLASLNAAPLLQNVALHAPSITVASGIAPRPYASADDARAVFLKHAVSPVLFTRAIGQCEDAGVTVYLQIGAGGPLPAFVRGMQPKDAVVLGLASAKDDDGGLSLLKTLARLWTLGVNLDVASLCAPAPACTLPTAQYARQRYWAVKDRRQRKLNVSVSKKQATSPLTPEAVSDNSLLSTNNADLVDARVIAVVAKVSAFPKDTIRPEMTLTDDLGFDSLMVADLATGLAEAFPSLPGIPQELLMNRPTVADLIAFASGAHSPSGAIDDDADLIAFSPRWVRTPLSPALQMHIPKLAYLSGAPPSSRWTDLFGEPQPVAQADWLLIEAPSDADLPGLIASGHTWSDPCTAVLDQLSKLPQLPNLCLLTPEHSVAGAGLAASLRSLSRETPSIRVKIMHLSGDFNADQAGVFACTEFSSEDLSSDVRFGQGPRSVRGFQPASVQPSWLVDEGKTLLITGGTRGIGAQLAAALAPTGATLLLLGRGAPSEEVEQLCGRYAGQVRVIQADVTDAVALSKALSAYSIHGLIHCAGLLADGAFQTVQVADGEASRRVKVQGWLNALRAIGQSLEVALGLGSWAGRFGNRHQVHYAAANAMLSASAHQLKSGLRCVIAELGPWINSEMVRSIPAPIIETMRAEGVDFVGDEAGVKSLLSLLQGGSGVYTMGRSLPSSTRVYEKSLTLSCKTHPFLLDHAIDDLPILPLASAADLLVSVSGKRAPFALEDLRLYSGVVVKEPVTLTLRADGDRTTIRTGDRGALAYRGTVRAFKEPAPKLPIQSGGEAPTLSLDAFYDITFHGPALQGISQIHAVGPDFVRGRVRTSKPRSWSSSDRRARWSIDPLALDSAMQLCGYVAWLRYKRAGTPVSVGRYVQLKAFSTAEVEVCVTFSEASDSSDRFVGTIGFYSDDGELLAIAEDVVAELRQQDDVLVIKPEWVDPSTWPAYKDLEQRLLGAKLMGIKNPYFAVHDATARDTTSVDGRELINFSSYNYLGLSGDKHIVARTQEAVARFGTSVSASRVASGERPFHGQLEALLAKCQDVDDALVFTAGHATNVTTIGHLFGPEDLILHDELIHDSIIQGIKLAGSARRTFKHGDSADLAAQLKTLRKHHQKTLIVVEGVYSMDGDLCDLPAYIALKKKFGCMLMVDEAHSFGIVGETGQGLREHFGISGSEVDIWMGTLSKSLSSCGGWIGGSKALIQYLRYTAPGFVYSAGLTPANGVAGLESLRMMLAEPERVKRLQQNSLAFHDALVEHGLNTGPARGESAVVPLVTGNSMHALLLSQRLMEHGINVQPIVYPAVSDDAARLRFFLSSTHSEQQLTHTAGLAKTLLDAIVSEFPFP